MFTQGHEDLNLEIILLTCYLLLVTSGLIQQCIEGALNTELPKCWKQYGECLDL